MEELNLVEKLRYCPIGTKFWTPMFGYLTFLGIEEGQKYPIRLFSLEGTLRMFTSNAKWLSEAEDTEPTLFPSKENRDWNTVDWSTPPLKKGDLVVCQVLNGYYYAIGRYVEGNVYRHLIKDNYGDMRCCSIIPYYKSDPRDIKSL